MTSGVCNRNALACQRKLTGSVVGVTVAALVTHTFRFGLTQKLRIKALGDKARCEGFRLCSDVNGAEYFVSYWNNGERKSLWLPEEELEEIE